MVFMFLAVLFYMYQIPDNSPMATYISSIQTSTVCVSIEKVSELVNPRSTNFWDQSRRIASSVPDVIFGKLFPRRKIAFHQVNSD